LHPDRIEYFIKPNSTTPQGTILIRDINAVHALEGDPESLPKNKFIIWTYNNFYSCYADNERDREEWIEAIETCLENFKQTSKESIIGKLTVTLIEANNIDWPSLSTTLDSYGIILLGNNKLRTDTIKNSFNPKFKNNTLEIDFRGENLIIQLWNEGFLISDDFIGSCTIILDNFMHENVEQVYIWEIYQSTLSEKSTGRITVYLKFEKNENYNDNTTIESNIESDDFELIEDSEKKESITNWVYVKPSQLQKDNNRIS